MQLASASAANPYGSRRGLSRRTGSRPTVPPPHGEDSVAWTETTSLCWRVLFEATRFPQDRQERWTAAANRRISTYRERLGLPVPERSIPARVVASERALASLGPNRLRTPNDRQGMLVSGVINAPAGLPEYLRTKPLLAMRHAWGAPASAAMVLAIARYAVGSIDGKKLSEVAKQIACVEERYLAETIFDASVHFCSPPVRDATGRRIGGGSRQSPRSRHSRQAAFPRP